MSPHTSLISKTSLFLFVFSFLVSSCGGGGQTPLPSPFPSPTPSPAPSSTPTAVPPSPTPIPLAALVNGEAITLAEYQSELARFKTARETPGTDLASEDKQRVLDELIDQLLLAQAAGQEGFAVDDTLLQARLDQLAQQIGGEQALEEWQSAHGYSPQDFRQALARASAAAWMRDQIAAQVPETAEQVHARQILVRDAGLADQALNQLRSGANFADLAAQYDPVRGGDLGWFPRGYLLEPALEEAAFSLQPGEHSDVIQTSLGFHILQVLERDAERMLDPDARLTLQTIAVRNWLEERRAQSEIQVLVP